jgi:hypothetical protein
MDQGDRFYFLKKNIPMLTPNKALYVYPYEAMGINFINVYIS